MTSINGSEQSSTRVFIGAIAAFTLFTATLGALFVGGDRWWIAFGFICAIPTVLGVSYATFLHFIARTR